MPKFNKGDKVRIQARDYPRYSQNGKIVTVARTTPNEYGADHVHVTHDGVDIGPYYDYDLVLVEAASSSAFHILRDGVLDPKGFETLEEVLEEARRRFGDTARFEVVKVQKVAAFKVSKVVVPA